MCGRQIDVQHIESSTQFGAPITQFSISFGNVLCFIELLYYHHYYTVLGIATFCFWSYSPIIFESGLLKVRYYATCVC